MEIAGTPVVVHALSQLHAGGIRKVVIVLGARGQLIRDAIEGHPIASRLYLQWIDLGEKYAQGFARSLLEASPLLRASRRPFLLCTSDHIFDAAIVRELASVDVAPSYDAVALIETDVSVEKAGRLAPTAVRVRLREVGKLLEEEEEEEHKGGKETLFDALEAGGGVASPSSAGSAGAHERRRQQSLQRVRPISQIGRVVMGHADGIEAGLYLCAAAPFFDALQGLSASKGYFTLAQAMATLATAGRLGSLPTDGRAWFAIETQDQLESTTREMESGGGGEGPLRRDASAVRFPWQVRLARADSFSDVRRVVDQRLVLAITAASTALRVLPQQPQPSSSSCSSSSSSSSSSAYSSSCGSASLAYDHMMSTHPVTASGGALEGGAMMAAASAAGGGAAAAGGGGGGFAIMPISPVLEPPPPSRHASSSGAPAEPSSSALQMLQEPLLPPASSLLARPVSPQDEAAAVDATSRVAASVSALDGGGDPALSMSIELPSGGGGIGGAADGHASDTTAFLIGVPEQRHEYVLAVPTPAVPASTPRPWWLCGLPLSLSLPSNVQSVRIEVRPDLTPMPTPSQPALPSPPLVKPQPSPATALRGELKLQMTVIKRVPPLGWALLAYSLLASYSAGTVVNVQAEMAGSGRHVFLRYVWRGGATSLVMLLVSAARKDGRASLHALAFTLPRSQWLLLLGAGLALWANRALFAYSSLAHAALFDSAAPVWLVVWQLLLAALSHRPPVARSNVLGVLLGLIGAIACMLDPSANNGIVPRRGLVADEIAVFSGLGACVYLQLAERLRQALDPTAFYFVVLVVYTLCSLLAAFTLDDEPPQLTLDPRAWGVLGWADPFVPGRLLSQLWLALVVDYSGNVGLIAVLKYVPALVVAAAMPLGPLFACLEGILVGVESVPGVYTLLGGATIALGSGLVAARAQVRRTTVDLGVRAAGAA